MPELVEIQGNVLLSWHADTAAEAIATSHDKKDTVASFNWIEVGYIFENRTSIDDHGDSILAEAIRESWEAHLLRLYPERRFDVRVLTPEETGSTVGVGFREID